MPRHAPPQRRAPLIEGEADDITSHYADLERQLREFRSVLAKRVLWLLTLVIVLYAVLVSTKAFTGVATDDIAPWFNTVFTGLMTLAGSAVGFYFGNSTASRVRED